MSDPFRPITTSRRLDVPRNHRVWTTSRQFPADFPLPLIGATMEGILGPGNDPDGFAWSMHRILSQPSIGRAEGALVPISITHSTVPGLQSGGTFTTFTEYESFPFRFPPIYPNGTSFFPGGSQQRPRTVTGRVVYEYAPLGSTRFNAWRAEETIWNYTDPTSGPFEVKSNIAKDSAVEYEIPDGGYSTVGRWLSAPFIFQDTINDAIAINIPGELAYTVVASAPSATVYAGWVAARTEFIAGRSIFQWQGDIYGRRTVYVMAQ
jgi:hypothetical protein